MSKPIKLTEEIQEEFLNKVKEELEKMKVYGGALKIEQKLPEIDRKAMVWFTPVAFSKMLSLIMSSMMFLCIHKKLPEQPWKVQMICIMNGTIHFQWKLC